MSNLPCGCQGHPRPALEHNENCKSRLGFFGANPDWGVGKIGEKRIYQGRIFVYTPISWYPTFDVKELRKEKLNKLNE